MKTSYKPLGVCSERMDIEVEDGIIKSVNILGGCDGNLKAVASLVRGMRVEDAMERLRGIKCGRKSTSCPDQLAQALEGILEKKSV